MLTTAVGLDVVDHLAEMTRTELVAIDSATTTRAFRQELRWSAAYRRLALGMTGA